jgi:hypothetical protein
MRWGEFREMVPRKFVPMNEQYKVKNEFLNLRMSGSDIKSYNAKFFAYSRLVPHLVTPESNQISHYIWGLVKEIRDMVRVYMPQTMDSTVELSGLLTDGMVRTHKKAKRMKLYRKQTWRREGLIWETKEGKDGTIFPDAKHVGKGMPGDVDLVQSTATAKYQGILPKNATEENHQPVLTVMS